MCKPINLGANTDPYQPIERERRITRSVLEVLAAHRHPVGIVTKSALVARDIDLLAPMSVRESIAVLLNDGQGHFTEGSPIAYPGRVGIHTLAVGQDRGGRYLLAGGSGALVLYRESQETPGRFENILLPHNWPSRLSRVELADVDGDGWLDALVANRSPLESEIIYGPLWDTFGKLPVNSPDKAQPDGCSPPNCE